MASGVYTEMIYKALSGNLNLSADTIKCALMNSSHSYNPENTVWSDVSANEISGTGYTSGGASMTGLSVTKDTTNHKVKFSANNVSWANATLTAYHAVLYDTTRSNTLLASIDFGGPQSVTNGTFTIQWNANGIIQFSVS